MATYAGEIVTRYTVDTSGFSSGISKMEQQAKSFDTMSKMHASNFQAAMGRLPNAMPPVQTALNKTSASVQSFGNQVQQTASTSSGHFSRLAQSTSSGFGGMARSVLAAGAGIGGWVYAAKSAGEAAVGLGRALFGSSADMEQTSVAFKGLLGSGKAADQMMRNLQAFAAKTPFEFPALAKDTQMLLGMGVAAKDVIPWMTAIGDAVAGMGGGPEQIEQVTRALGQMQAKGKIAGDEMMQLQEGGINGYKLLAQQMGLTEVQVRKLGDQGKLGQNEINLLVKGMEKMYGGQMAAQAGTFNGLLSTLKDNAGAALRAFTGPMFETAKKALAGLVNAIDPDKNPGFAKFVKVVGQDVGNAVNGVATVVQNIVKFFTGLHTAVNTTNPTMQRFASIGGSLRDIFTTLGNVIGAVGRGFSQGLAPFLTPIVGTFTILAATTSRVLAPAFAAMSRGIQGLLSLPLISWGQTLGSIFGTVLSQGLVILTDLVSGLGPLFQTLGPIAGAIMGNFSDEIEQVSGFITTSLIPAIQALSPTFQRIGDLFTSTIIPAFLTILPVAMQVASMIRNVFLVALSAALPVIVNIANFISSLLVPAIKFIAPYISLAAKEIGKFAGEIAVRVIPIIQQFAANIMNGVNTIKTIWMAVWPILGPIVGGVFQEIVGILKIAWAIISGIFKIALDLLSGNWGQAWTDLKDMLGGVWDGIVTVLRGALQVVTGLLGGIGAIVGGAFSALGTKVNEIWTGIVSAISGFMTTIWNAIVAPFVALWGAISGPLQAIWNGIVAVFSPMITFISDVMRIIFGIISLGWMVVSNTIKDTLTKISNTVTSVWNIVWGTISHYLNLIWSIITSVWNTISGFIGSILSTIWNTEVRGWTNIWNTISGWMNRIWSTVTIVWNTIKNAVTNTLNVLGGIISNAWNSFFGTISHYVSLAWTIVTSTFNRIRDTVGGIFRGMINNIIAWLNPGLNAISNFLNFFINGINKVSQFFIKKDLLGTVHLGPIGYLAHGTQDWRGGLAVVGEEGPELVSLPKHAAVLPHNESEDWLAGRTKFPSFAGGVGDFLGNIFSWISGGVGDIAGNVMNNLFANAPSLGIFGDIAGSLLGKVAGWLGQWIKDNISSLFGSFTGTLPAMQQGQFLLPPNLGFPGYPGHHGMDFQFPQGSPVTEIVGGTVSPHTGWYSFGGEIDVLIDRIAGMWERYLHMSQIFVQGGQRVNRGDLIGLSGGGTPASGLGRGSNGPHLHLQYDWGDYSNFVPPLNVWSALGMFDPFMLAGQGTGPGGRNRAFKKGGIISEQVRGIGVTSGQDYSFGEHGMESVMPASAQERMTQALERIERLLSNDGRITEYQITQALGRLLANGVR